MALSLLKEDFLSVSWYIITPVSERVIQLCEGKVWFCFSAPDLECTTGYRLEFT
jgi:hypothetical protein